MQLSPVGQGFSKSNGAEQYFLGYGNKGLLTDDEVHEAMTRINSYHGVNFIVSAPGKLILFGEHAVIYGGSAIAASINKRTFLRFTENKVHNIFVIRMRDINFSYHVPFDKIIKFINEDIPGHDLKPLKKPVNDCSEINHERFLEILKENYEKNIQPLKANGEQTISFCVFLYLLHVLFYKENSELGDSKLKFLSPMVIDITSELILNSGMGSSSSFCVCIAAALLYYKNIKIHGLNLAKEMTFSEKGIELISKFALSAETIIHGHSSGIGSAVSTYGSFVQVKCIDSNRKFINLPDPPKLHIVLVDSGIKRNTFELINDVARRHYFNVESIEQIFNSIHHVSEKASQLIKKMGYSQVNGSLDLPDYKLLEELVNINQGLLYSLGVSNKCLQQICSICLEYDLSAKLTGAGGGGCAFVLVSPDFDKSVLFNCINKLKDNSFEVHDIELGDKGVRLDDLTQFKR